MLIRTLMVMPMIAGAGLGMDRCENPIKIRGDFGPAGVHFEIESDPKPPEYICVDWAENTFELDGVRWNVIDYGCDGTPDVLHSEDGEWREVRPAEGRFRARTILSESWLWQVFDPATDINWDAWIDDGTESPFNFTTTHRWLGEHGLLNLEEGEPYTSPITVDELSPTDWLADVTVGLTSRMRVPGFEVYGLAYQWFGAWDEQQELFCWSVRIRGDLTAVAYWLKELGVFELNVQSGANNWLIVWNEFRDVIEIWIDGSLEYSLEMNLD